MKMVTYKVLSKAMRELTGQVAELDEAIERGDLLKKLKNKHGRSIEELIAYA